MRILVLTPTFLPVIGGAELAIYEVYRRLARSHDVLVLTPQRSDLAQRELGSPEYENGINFRVKRFSDRVNLLRIRGHRLSRGLIPPFSLSSVAALTKAVRQFRPHVINVHYAVPTGLAALSAQYLQRVPVVLTFTGSDVPGPRTPVLWKYYDRVIARLVVDVTCVSNYCRFAVGGPLSAGKGRVVYNGVDTDLFNPQVDGSSVRRRLGLDNDAIVLFALQRLWWDKRVDVVIRSMPYVWKTQKNVVLIVGGKGPAEQGLRDLTKEMDVGDRVVFAGHIQGSQLPSYFAAADIFVFHSTHETFGIVLAQAMAAGKPIVSVSTTAITEVVDDGVNGVLVEPMNPRLFAAGIIDLLRNEDLRLRLGRSGREKAVRLFNWDQIASQYETVLTQAVHE